MSDQSVVAQLREDAAAADALHMQSRQLLTAAAQAGRKAGLSQREIALAIGRSQPEVSRLLRFKGETPLGGKVSGHRSALIRAIRQSGGRNPKVFGSVARGEDTQESDIDLLVDFPSSIGLFTLARLEQDLSQLLDASVDIVSADSLRENLRDRVLTEAVPL